MNNYICALLLSVVSLTSVAKNIPANTYTFTENDTISLPLSSVNLNRLVVAQDSITAFTCPIGFCTTAGNKNDTSGSVTLKINVSLPFTAHIATLKGRNFTLFINPKRIPAVVTEFIALQYEPTAESVFDKAFDYPTALAQFTKQMISWKRAGTPISGSCRTEANTHGGLLLAIITE